MSDKASTAATTIALRVAPIIAVVLRPWGATRGLLWSVVTGSSGVVGIDATQVPSTRSKGDHRALNCGLRRPTGTRGRPAGDHRPTVHSTAAGRVLLGLQWRPRELSRRSASGREGAAGGSTCPRRGAPGCGASWWPFGSGSSGWRGGRSRRRRLQPETSQERSASCAVLRSCRCGRRRAGSASWVELFGDEAGSGAEGPVGRSGRLRMRISRQRRFVSRSAECRSSTTRRPSRERLHLSGVPGSGVISGYSLPLRVPSRHAGRSRCKPVGQLRPEQPVAVAVGRGHHPAAHRTLLDGGAGALPAGDRHGWRQWRGERVRAWAFWVQVLSELKHLPASLQTISG